MAEEVAPSPAKMEKTVSFHPQPSLEEDAPTPDTTFEHDPREPWSFSKFLLVQFSPIIVVLPLLIGWMALTSLNTCELSLSRQTLYESHRGITNDTAILSTAKTFSNCFLHKQKGGIGFQEVFHRDFYFRISTPSMCKETSGWNTPGWSNLNFKHVGRLLTKRDEFLTEVVLVEGARRSASQTDSL